MDFLTLFCVGNLATVSAAIQFNAFGDWGLETQTFLEVAEFLHTSFPNRNFTLLLGDNFYPGGVKDVDDEQFQLFEKYLSSSSSTPFYPILGNHDYMANATAQLDYRIRSALWDMPSKYYLRVYEAQGVRICMFMIDTVELSPLQLEWLNSKLSSPECLGNSTWRIVAGHYPIWSAGMYSDSQQLKDLLLPILHLHGVRLYLCGHEHLHEVFWDGQIAQVTSGAVALMRKERSFEPHPYHVWGLTGLEVNGLVNVVARVEQLEISILSAKGGHSFVDFTINQKGNTSFALHSANMHQFSSKSDFSTLRFPLVIFALTIAYLL